MCDYYHVLNDDTNETILTTTDPVRATERVREELDAGTNVRFVRPCTVQVEDCYYYPGQLISIEERAE